MIIISAPRYKIESLISYVPIAIGIAFFSILGFFLMHFSQESAMMKNSSFSSSLIKPPIASLSEIGSGPLSLSQEKLFKTIPDLGNELIILARNTRPDKSKEEASLLLSLKSSREEKIVEAGESLYLEKAKDGILRFSQNPTALSIKPLVLDVASVLIEAKSEQEKAQFVVKDLNSGPKDAKRDIQPAFKTLKEAKVWGVDILVQQYGGEEYRSERDKVKIEFSNANASYVAFVSSGDTLTWEGDRWQVVPLGNASKKQPIAQVKSIGAKGVEIEAWDESGFYPFQFKVETLRPAKLNYKPENMPSSLRLRSTSAVTCILGKRRVILKKGDWLLRTANGWRNLKKLEEIEGCIQHKLKGELFIFDSLEKDGGKMLLKGHLFDEMRTQMQEVILPVVGEKKERSSNKKKTPKAAVA